MLADPRDADALSGEAMTVVDLAPAKTDAAAAGDHDGLIVKGIGQLLETR
jgi:hypothetical protein